MPPRQGLRPLKAWRYVGIYGPELMLCLAQVRVGPFRQSFWAVWDREEGRLHERTARGIGAVGLSRGHARILDPVVQADVSLAETAGVESVCPAGAHHAWTRKQGGVAATGTVSIGGRPRRLEALAIIDDSAGYHPRHTHWRWSAGVGTGTDGRPVAWNLVEGINDPVAGSERTVWLEGCPQEVPPVRFTDDLSAAGELRFAAEATRERHENRLLIRSRYRQPFGTFSGRLPGGVELAAGWGVMEEHDVVW